jgi:hypothetical protein
MRRTSQKMKGAGGDLRLGHSMVATMVWERIHGLHDSPDNCPEDRPATEQSMHSELEGTAGI